MLRLVDPMDGVLPTTYRRCIGRADQRSCERAMRSDNAQKSVRTSSLPLSQGSEIIASTFPSWISPPASSRSYEIDSRISADRYYCGPLAVKFHVNFRTVPICPCIIFDRFEISFVLERAEKRIKRRLVDLNSVRNNELPRHASKARLAHARCTAAYSARLSPEVRP